MKPPPPIAIGAKMPGYTIISFDGTGARRDGDLYNMNINLRIFNPEPLKYEAPGLDRKKVQIAFYPLIFPKTDKVLSLCGGKDHIYVTIGLDEVMVRTNELLAAVQALANR